MNSIHESIITFSLSQTIQMKRNFDALSSLMALNDMNKLPNFDSAWIRLTATIVKKRNIEEVATMKFSIQNSGNNENNIVGLKDVFISFEIGRVYEENDLI